jgi:hypothetical protein
MIFSVAQDTSDILQKPFLDIRTPCICIHTKYYNFKKFKLWISFFKTIGHRCAQVLQTYVPFVVCTVA